MGIRWLWALGAVACILFGAVWASAENPAAYPGLRAWLEWLIDWLNKNGDAVTALAAIIALLFGIVQVLAARADTRARRLNSIARFSRTPTLCSIMSSVSFSPSIRMTR